MTRIEYDLLRFDRRELKLPPFECLHLAHQVRVTELTQEELAACRCAKLLTRDPGVVDALRFNPDADAL